jgi:tyrosinase
MVRLSERDPTDPLGWTFQYKIHQFPDNGLDILFDETIPPPQRRERLREAKEAELTKYFGAAADGNIKRTQAEAAWGKCPHSGRQTFAPDFFPWHRKYLFFFERIVRKLSGDAEFALPYWGYMEGASSQRMPPQFIAALPNPLAHGRAPSINEGSQLDRSTFEGAFWREPREFQPFAQSAEKVGPHDPVHGEVGSPPSGNFTDRFDMADVFRSPRDPIFWLHHCELDRIWEGGRQAGFPVPDDSWLSQPHHFFDDNRKFVELTNADVLNTKQVKDWPGYEYDEVPKPAAEPIMVAMAASSQTNRRTLATAKDVALRSGLQTMTIAPTAAMMAAPLAADGARSVILEVSDVTLSRGAVANVGLYLNAPAGAVGEQLEKFLVGTVSTFSVLPEGVSMDHANHEAEATPPKYSFDVTRLVADLQKQGLWTDDLKLTSKEVAGSLGGATLKLGNVELVEITEGPARE